MISVRLKDNLHNLLNACILYPENFMDYSISNFSSSIDILFFKSENLLQSLGSYFD